MNCQKCGYPLVQREDDGLFWCAVNGWHGPNAPASGPRPIRYDNYSTRAGKLLEELRAVG